jgi:hypothetical protein
MGCQPLLLFFRSQSFFEAIGGSIRTFINRIAANFAASYHARLLISRLFTMMSFSNEYVILQQEGLIMSTQARYLCRKVSKCTNALLPFSLLVYKSMDVQPANQQGMMNASAAQFLERCSSIFWQFYLAIDYKHRCGIRKAGHLAWAAFCKGAPITGRGLLQCSEVP